VIARFVIISQRKTLFFGSCALSEEEMPMTLARPTDAASPSLGRKNQQALTSLGHERVVAVALLNKPE
jgi:hypothetical protein